MLSVAALLLSVSITPAPADAVPNLVGRWSYNYGGTPGQIEFYDDGYYHSHHRTIPFRGQWFVNLRGDLVLLEGGRYFTYRFTKVSSAELSGFCLENKHKVHLSWLTSDGSSDQMK